jgi:hypothetical protein
VRRTRRVVGLTLGLALGITGLAAGQVDPTFTASLLGGIGTSFDAEGERTDGNPALQAGFGMLTGDRTYSILRLGRIDFDRRMRLEGLDSPRLDYLNVAGEYRFRQPTYDFGFFLGLGGYRLSGRAAGGRTDEESALGLTLGLLGEFDWTRRLSLLAQFEAHYVFFDDEKLYGAALAGVAIHF